MELFVNDLSLHEQFTDSAAFRQAIAEIMRCRQCAMNYQRVLFVPRSIVAAKVMPGRTFREMVQSFNDINITRQIMAWIDKHGPFVDDELMRDPDEYFTYGLDAEIVTDTVLGEVATRHLAERQVATVSFAPSKFDFTPLEVSWHKDDRSVETCFVGNFFQHATLEQHLQLLREEARTWPELLQNLLIQCPQLTFLQNLEQHLEGQPFLPAVARRVVELLQILNQLKTCFDEHGQRTAEGDLLFDNYFRRQNALFTDASESEKSDPVFRAAMTFRDDSGKSLECFWHGKIRTHVFRIHFTYPIEHDKPLIVAYIGPKLTKK